MIARPGALTPGTCRFAVERDRFVDKAPDTPPASAVVSGGRVTVSGMTGSAAPRRAALHLDVVRWCPSCADDVFLERPDCTDEHGADCPERVCVRCGVGLFVGFDLPSPAPAPAARRRRTGRVA